MTRHLITSALPYINGTKHLGNLVGSLLPADATARWLRAEGHRVLFVCGTDEHGAPAELAAAAAGLPVADYCARQHAVQQGLYHQLGLSFDHFGRTSDEATATLTLSLYERLGDAGLLERREVRQLYSPTDGRFLPDRYVRGTCPHCGSPNARGDQCEDCTRLLDPDELVDPFSALSGARDLETRPSEHVFLALSRLAPHVERYLDDHPGWPALTRQVARAWLARGLQDRCITRDLSWGVPVPDLPGKVFYCWFDAPIGYIGLTRERCADWEDWWRPGADVLCTQFLGKDNLPFHTVLFPAVLLGTGTFRPADRIKAFHWLDWYGEKFSSSAGRGIFLDRALALAPPEVWRWGLLAQAPESADSTFTWEHLCATVNKDLVGQLGNFVHRVHRLVERGGAVVPSGGSPGEAERALEAAVRAELEGLRQAWDDLRFREVIARNRALWRLGNGYVDRRAPWQLLRDDPDQAATVLRTCLNLTRVFAVAAAPILPWTADRLLGSLGLPDADRSLGGQRSLDRHGGAPLALLPPLFQRIEPPPSGIPI